MKKTIRLHERDLHRMIKEAVKRTINEATPPETWDRDYYSEFISSAENVIERLEDLRLISENIDDHFTQEITQYKTGIEQMKNNVLDWMPRTPEESAVLDYHDEMRRRRQY